jgi:Reverse transcriptase (RNA-dependent DNA polymerase).
MAFYYVYTAVNWHIGKVGVLKTCFDGTQSKVRIGNYLFSSFPIENGLKQRDTLSPFLFNFLLEYAISKVQETYLRLIHLLMRMI